MKLHRIIRHLLIVLPILSLFGCGAPAYSPTPYDWRSDYNRKVESGNWENAYTIVEAELQGTNDTLSSIGIPIEHYKKLYDGGYISISEYINAIAPTMDIIKQNKESYYSIVEFINKRIDKYLILGAPVTDIDKLNELADSTFGKDNLRRIKAEDTAKKIAREGNVDIDIKGIHIGMSRADYNRIVTSNRFTIAGIYSKYESTALDTEFSWNGLSDLIFFFDSEYFIQMHVALTRKYPSMTCTDSIVGNKMGANFNQVRCRLEGKRGVLTLKKYLDLSTSILSLVSYEVAKKNRMETDSDLNDI